MGIFQTLISKYKDAKQKPLNRKKYLQALQNAVADGKLTKDEIDELEKMKTALELSDQEIQGMRADVFAAALKAAKADEKVTKNEEEELLQIQKYLGLGDDEIHSSKQELARLRLLNEIQNGNVPTMPSVENLIMQKGETTFWVEPVILAEEKVVSRRYEGGSQGMSFRVMKGVSYRVGGQRGHLISETGIVAVASGDLIITSQRLIFKGDKKSFAIKLEKLLDVQIFTNGCQFSENNKSKPRMMKFMQEGDHHIIGAILSHAINHRSDK